MFGECAGLCFLEEKTRVGFERMAGRTRKDLKRTHAVKATESVIGPYSTTILGSSAISIHKIYED